MTSMQEYLKRYTSDADKKKKKKKKKSKSLHGGSLTITDADPVWQKEVKDESLESESEKEDAPLVIEDVEFKRLKRLDLLRTRPYLSTAADGSGWVSVNDTKNQVDLIVKESIPEDGMDAGLRSPQGKDLSPPRKARHSSSQMTSPKKDASPPGLSLQHQDLSPPRRQSGKRRHNFLEKITESEDWSPSRGDPDIVKIPNVNDISPPRRTSRVSNIEDAANNRDEDLSPPRRHSRIVRHDSPESPSVQSKNILDGSSTKGIQTHAYRDMDLSPPRIHSRRIRHDSPESVSLQTNKSSDKSSPREQKVHAHKDGKDLPPTRRNHVETFFAGELPKPKRKEAMGDGSSAGLHSGTNIAKETLIRKKTDSRRMKELDLTISGRHASTVYRDKHGKRLETVDEILKLQQAEEPKKDKPLEWGKGLVQKREAEVQHAEIEAEKTKPFARTIEDLDAMLREQVRWGDPMAHLVKKKIAEPALVDLGASENMKSSGFIVPQEIPAHSWLKRGIAPPPNRYSIRPGRHWDGVDRSTGYERDMYKRQNERKAEQEEAYLWSVADM